MQAIRTAELATGAARAPATSKVKTAKHFMFLDWGLFGRYRKEDAGVADADGVNA
jgi:hypothetical protein